MVAIANRCTPVRRTGVPSLTGIMNALGHHSAFFPFTNRKIHALLLWRQSPVCNTWLWASSSPFLARNHTVFPLYSWSFCLQQWWGHYGNQSPMLIKGKLGKDLSIGLGRGCHWWRGRTQLCSSSTACGSGRHQYLIFCETGQRPIN